MLGFVLVSALTGMLLLGGVHCFPSGAGRSACVTMQPGHYGTYKQDLDTAPYMVTVSQTIYTPGGSLEVTIEPKNTSAPLFKGFLLRAVRLQGNIRQHIGRFIPSIDPATGTKCDGPFGHVLTHSNRGLKHSLRVQWQAPAKSQGPIVFLATVVQKYTRYWVAIQSSLVMDASPRRPLPVETSRPQITPSVTPDPISDEGDETRNGEDSEDGSGAVLPPSPDSQEESETKEIITPGIAEEGSGSAETPTPDMSDSKEGSDTIGSTTPGIAEEGSGIVTPPTPDMPDSKGEVDTRGSATPKTDEQAFERMVAEADVVQMGPENVTSEGNEENESEPQGTHKTTTPRPLPKVRQGKFRIGTGECGVKKGCFRFPDNCKEADCSLLVIWEDLGDTVNIELSGATNGWVAVGFSKDMNMGNDSVTECVFIREEGRIDIRNSYNLAGGGRNQVFKKGAYEGLSEMEGFVTEKDGSNKLRCRFNRKKLATKKGVFDLNRNYYILLARGTAQPDGTKAPHLFSEEDGPKVSQEPVNTKSRIDITVPW